MDINKLEKINYDLQMIIYGIEKEFKDIDIDHKTNITFHGSYLLCDVYFVDIDTDKDMFSITIRMDTNNA